MASFLEEDEEEQKMSVAPKPFDPRDMEEPAAPSMSSGAPSDAAPIEEDLDGLTQQQIDATNALNNTLQTKQGYLAGLRERLMARGDAVAEGESRRGFNNALMKAAAQIGSFQGKKADTSYLDKFKEDLDAANRLRFEKQYKSYEGAAKQLADEQDAATSERRFQQDQANKSVIAAATAGDKEAAARLKDTMNEYYGKKTAQVGKPTPGKAAKTPDEIRAQLTLYGKSKGQRTTIANTLASGMRQFKNAKSINDKVLIGESMLKSLNSLQGNDALAAEEARRAGRGLNFETFNIKEAGPTFGRDLDAFVRKVEAIQRSLAEGAQMDQYEIDKLNAKLTGQAAPEAPNFDQAPEKLYTVKFKGKTMKVKPENLKRAVDSGAEVISGPGK